MTSSRPKRRDWDFKRSYSYWSDPPPRPVDLPHVASLTPSDGETPGVPLGHTEWCRENCKHPWAWWFDESRAYMGFADQGEYLLYQLIKQ